jgi:hypothetical protein
VPSRAEQAFHSETLAGADCLKKEIGYNPTRFNQMVAEHGGPEAVRLLLKGRDASDGFTTLWEAGRLEMSCEAIALKLMPWYQELFNRPAPSTLPRGGRRGVASPAVHHMQTVTSGGWPSNCQYALESARPVTLTLDSK